MSGNEADIQQVHLPCRGLHQTLDLSQELLMQLYTPAAEANPACGAALPAEAPAR